VTPPRRRWGPCEARQDPRPRSGDPAERQDPPDDLIAVALGLGCLFSIDSDAHAPGQLSLLDYGAERAERAGVPPERIVTTWPLERLREWTARDR